MKFKLKSTDKIKGFKEKDIEIVFISTLEDMIKEYDCKQFVIDFEDMEIEIYNGWRE